jgi:hypothetical protein
LGILLGGLEGDCEAVGMVFVSLGEEIVGERRRFIEVRISLSPIVELVVEVESVASAPPRIWQTAGLSCPSLVPWLSPGQTVAFRRCSCSRGGSD